VKTYGRAEKKGRLEKEIQDLVKFTRNYEKQLKIGFMVIAPLENKGLKEGAARGNLFLAS